MAANTDRFDEDAAAWEADPACVTSAELVYKALLQHVPQFQPGGKKPDILDVGGGSGTLSFMLAPHVHTLTAIDIAPSMVAAFNANAAQRGAHHMEAVIYERDLPDFTVAPEATTRLLQTVDGKAPEGPVRWDILLSNLVTHHYSQLNEWMQIAYFSLAPGGRIVMTDFEHTGPDSALFHAPGKRDSIPMHGLKPAEISKLMSDAGFVDVSVKRVFSLDKAVDPQEAGGRTSIEFPILLCLGSKPMR
ncbi:Mannitol 1-phosphate dehydrogenase [Neofusicoccum parvum]|uniref:Mannitol 1-phosphate dehydrogenase n=2 Tax=Neofusicoccum parvum TaxID=310453 RepID=A0ACB5RW68_9PEZI|nr:putative methyltransferase type 11 protein [Neofusicoccum parvum UCRNP2]GME24815.1 Mannitol 1-phosphate dehydrogenase [Neofusicoccum parvum]GME37583.1 Mannitol 1-phosphate dehydrogenase [Neofusicoccum parvum]